jgi:hypothetical protein
LPAKPPVVLGPTRSSPDQEGRRRVRPQCDHFQQGNLPQAVGQQDAGFVTAFAGLQTVIDPNIGTTYSVGGNMNEDEAYVVYSDDLVLFEGVAVVEVFRDVLSSTMGARLRLYSYSALVSGRQPKSIAKLAGSGFAEATF